MRAVVYVCVCVGVGESVSECVCEREDERETERSRERERVSQNQGLGGEDESGLVYVCVGGFAPLSFFVRFRSLTTFLKSYHSGDTQIYPLNLIKRHVISLRVRE